MLRIDALDDQKKIAFFLFFAFFLFCFRHFFTIFIVNVAYSRFFCFRRFVSIFGVLGRLSPSSISSFLDSVVYFDYFGFPILCHIQRRQSWFSRLSHIVNSQWTDKILSGGKLRKSPGLWGKVGFRGIVWSISPISRFPKPTFFQRPGLLFPIYLISYLTELGGLL
jgi:hypothetical protein